MRWVDVMRSVGLVVLDLQAPGLQQLARVPGEADVHDGVPAAVGDEGTQPRAVGQGRLPSLHGRHEAREREDARRRRSLAPEPERVAHHRAHREPAEDGALRADAGALPQVVVEVGEPAEGGVKGLGVGIADAGNDVPVVARQAGSVSGARGVTTCRRRRGSSASARPSRSCSSAPRPWWRTSRPAGSPAAARSR